MTTGSLYARAASDPVAPGRVPPPRDAVAEGAAANLTIGSARAYLLIHD